MKRLLVKLFIFPLPLAVLFAFPAWVFLASGEWLGADALVQRQQHERPVRIEPAYSDQFGYIKLKTAQEKKPEILALGTSRVMQFRADFFNGSFYNAGIGGLRLEDHRKFIGLLDPETGPKLIILGLDQRHFNPNFYLQPIDMFKKPSHDTNWIMLLSAWDDIYLGWLKGKFKISDLTRARADNIERIGLSALVHESGFHNDGSHLWHWRESYDKDMHNLAHNKDTFIRADKLSEKSLEEVDALLLFCQQRGILVAGFLPPFAPSVYSALEKERRNFAYVFETADRLKPIFKKYGFPFADFTDPKVTGIENLGFHDGEHPSETAYRSLWNIWTEREPALKAYRRS